MFEMKEAVDVLTARPDLLYVTDVQQLAGLELHLADLAKRIDLFGVFVFVPAVDGRAMQDLKRSAKPVLVRRCCPLKPKVNVDVKTRSGICGDRRLAKPPRHIALRRELRLFERPF